MVLVFDGDTNAAWSSVNNSGFSGFTAAVTPPQDQLITPIQSSTDQLIL